MFARIRRLLNQFFRRSRTINNEPLNRVSLIVIILIDIFILINVFTGLDDISRWYISPTQTYPCYSEWQNYRAQTTNDRDYQLIQQALPAPLANQPSFQQLYQQEAEGHLGSVSSVCLQYAGLKDKINNSANQQIQTTIGQKQTAISKLDQANQDIRARYDSTLLEQIAGQPRQQSINPVAAEQAKQTLEKNNQQIATLRQEIATLKTQLVAKPESAAFLSFVKPDEPFKTVAAGYERSNFWYPSIQLVFQALFLLPLIFIALSIYRFADRRGYGLMALMSWHLLVIFLIPLVLKVFEFLQVGVLFQWLFDAVIALLGGLLFLVSYLYIFLIPLIGFGIIKFFQRIILNPKMQAANRIQSSRCINCAKRIRHQDTHCPYCGYYQATECPNCQNLTYKYLPYCRHCGHSQDLSDLIRR